MEKASTQNVNVFPRFIPTNALGEDLLIGHSQDRLAETVARHIIDNDNKDIGLPRIIGIQGPWGSGKTNVVKNLENKIKDKYVFFEYDAWGHQVDLQRKSIIVDLTNKLLANGLLPKKRKTTPSILDRSVKVSWEEKLKELLARKKEVVTRSIPVLDGGAVFLLICLMLTSITVYIANALDSIVWYQKALLAFSPIIIFVVVAAFLALFFKKYRNFGYYLSISKKGSCEDKSTEIVNEEDPSVASFRQWMQDLSNYIQEKGEKRLVLIFDNMDRLKKEQVHELWSSIHTFFSGDSFTGIWVIIPFDFNHIKENFEDETTTELFIQKTFPVVYRVSSPVVTDYKQLFCDLFIRAFGEDRKYEEKTVNRIYRLAKPSPNIRDIISFINELVALYQEWGTSIRLNLMSIYILFGKEGMTDNQILNGEFVKDYSIQKLVHYDESAQGQIAALHYGIEVEHAKQIPLYNYITACISDKKKYDINKYSESNKNFDSILHEVAERTDDLQLDKFVMNCMVPLSRNNNAIIDIWDSLCMRLIDIQLTKQVIPQYYYEVLGHANKNQQELVNHIYNDLCAEEDFDGGKYYSAIEHLCGYIHKNEISVSLQEREIALPPDQFYLYVEKAGSSFGKHNVSTDNILFNDWIIDIIRGAEKNPYDVIKTLMNDGRYDFTAVYNALEDLIRNWSPIHNHQRINPGAIISIYRLLRGGEKIQLFIPQQVAANIEASHREKKDDGYYDALSTLIYYGNQLNVTLKETELQLLASIVFNYISFDTLINNALSNRSQLMVQLFRHCIVNKIGESIRIKPIISKLSVISSHINIECDILLTAMSEYGKASLEEITGDNILSVLPEGNSVYDACLVSDSPLANRIKEAFISSLNNHYSGESLFTSYHTNHNAFVHRMIKGLIGTDLMKSNMPRVITDFAELLFVRASTGETKLPADNYIDSIISAADKNSLALKAREIMNDYCNQKKSINVNSFLFFEKWFRELKYPNDRPGEFVHFVLSPVFANNKCRDRIIQNSNYYVPIIKQAGVEADDLKKEVRNIMDRNSADSVIDFAPLIGL